MPITQIGGGGAATNVTTQPGSVVNATVVAGSSTAINDGVATGQKATVTQFHNADNQALGATAFGILTGGVAQLLNAANNVDRQRETGSDNISATGVATGTQQLKSPISTTLAAQATAGATSATLAGTRFTNRGAAAWIYPGSVLTMEAGTANQELVRVLTVNYGSNVVTIAGLGTGGANTGFQFTHANGTALVAGSYNEARDATTPDGSTGAGFAAGATYLLNQTLNAGAGGWEGERSAAGELDGANGSGTAIAAEYEWNGNVPANGGVLSGAQFDRARNLNGKGLGAGTLSNNPLAANSTTLNLNVAPTTLIPGQKILLDRAGANPETNYVGTAYTPSSTTAPLQIATQFSHAQNATVEWDQHMPLGPGLNGFLPDGIGIEEEALWDPVSQKFYLERSATQDAVSGQNVVMESVALQTGAATFDRMRTPSVFKPQNTVAVAATPGTPVWTPAAGKKFRIMRAVISSSVVGNVVLTDGSGGTVLAVIPITATANAPVTVDLGNGYLSAAANNQVFAFNSGGAANISGTLMGTEE